MPSRTPAFKRRDKAEEQRTRSPSLKFLVEPSSGLFPSGEDILKLLLVVFIAVSVAIVCSFVSGFLNRHPEPFCDSGDASNDLDFCETCPLNGWCSNGELNCLHGYEKQGRICVQDGKLYQSAYVLAKVVENYACQSFAHVLCDQDGKIWFQEDDVEKIIDDRKAKNYIQLADDTFNLAKKKSLEIVQDSLESKTHLNGSKEYKCPEILAEHHKPFGCRIHEWIYGHVLLVTGVFTFVPCLIWSFWILYRKQILSSRAEKIYEEVCEILEDNAMVVRRSNEGEPWIVTSWLRDHLLLPKERKDTALWKKVEELIQEDSALTNTQSL
ncbi:hypothetical protein HPP92_025397 [Vanilla planifolia]|uniref:Man1/Src1-like C-terminal domain-containing protein n=1 Tax=Vanilla planifolia TaxID=51239 RepID=A0A835PK13_VANPL|nr:hypothetical protein HPP92_025397 [Vanilla planifolia]